MEGDKSNINTYQIAFKEEKSKEIFNDFDVIHFSKTGRVMKVVIRGDKKVVMDALKKLNPILLEIIPLNFEDIFVYQVEKEGYIDHE